MKPELTEEQLDKLKSFNMDEGAPLHIWKLRGDSYYFEELPNITSMNCHLYSRKTCKMCNSKGYRVYNKGEVIWRQACDCVRRNVEKSS